MAAGATPAAGRGERGAGPRGRWVRARERGRGREREPGRGGQWSRRGQPARAGGWGGGAARRRDGAQPAGFAPAARRAGREPAVQRRGLAFGGAETQRSRAPRRGGMLEGGKERATGIQGHFRLSPAGRAGCRRNSTEGPLRLPSPNPGQAGLRYMSDHAKGEISAELRGVFSG